MMVDQCEEIDMIPIDSEGCHTLERRQDTSKIDIIICDQMENWRKAKF